MTRKIIIIYFFLVILSIISACRCEDKHRIVGPYELTAVKLNVTSHEIVEIINFEFSLQYISKLETAYLTPNFNLISNSYARSCVDIFENEILEDEIELLCDKEFIYNNDTIKANSNLLILPELKPKVDKGFGSISIDFLNSFLNKVKLPKDFYVFKLVAKTTDNITLEAEEKVYLDF